MKTERRWNGTAMFAVLAMLTFWCTANSANISKKVSTIDESSNNQLHVAIFNQLEDRLDSFNKSLANLESMAHHPQVKKVVEPIKEVDDAINTTETTTEQ